jgi:hypothetical protein
MLIRHVVGGRSAHHVGPNSCFMNPVYWNTHNIVINGTTIGTYEAGINQSTCQSTTHDVYGDMFLWGGGCTSSRITVTWIVNGIWQNDNNPTYYTIGPNNCPTGQEIYWESSSVTGHYYICVYMTARYSGNDLNPQAACATSSSTRPVRALRVKDARVARQHGEQYRAVSRTWGIVASRAGGIGGGA